MGHFLTDFKRSLCCRIKCFASGNSIRDSTFLRLLHEIQKLGRKTCRFLAWHEEKAHFCEKQRRRSGARQTAGGKDLLSCWWFLFWWGPETFRHSALGDWNHFLEGSFHQKRCWVSPGAFSPGQRCPAIEAGP